MSTTAIRSIGPDLDNSGVGFRPIGAAQRATGSTPSGPLLTTNDLGIRWARSPRTLANMRSKGEGPAYLKVNGHAVRYRLADVEAYEEQSLAFAGAV